MAEKKKRALSTLNEITKEIYEGRVKAELEKFPIYVGELYPNGPPPRNPKFHLLSTGGITNVGEFKKFLEENNVPDHAYFSDTGYECDGTYNISWTDD